MNSNTSSVSVSRPTCFETTPAESSDCPICFDSIDPVNNRIVTTCGHLFHASCMFQNAAINGFGCPCCRNVLAETPANINGDDDDDSEEYDDDESDDSDASYAQHPIEIDHTLTSFRMFHQRIMDEEVEEEPIEFDYDDESDEEYELDEDDPSLATVDDIANHFAANGFTLSDAFLIILNRKRTDRIKDKQFIDDTIRTIKQLDNASKRNFYA